jgi:Fanconi anemia group M protein
MPKPPIVIWANPHEGNAPVIEALRELGAQVETSELAVGDFTLSDEIVVERKGAFEFAESVVTAQLFREMAAMKEAVAKPLLLLEGDYLHAGRRRVHPNALRGAIAFVAVNLEVPVLCAGDAEESAQFLYLIARHAQAEGRKPAVRHRPGPRSDGLSRAQIEILSILPGVGEALAATLLRHFGSLERVMLATEEELREVRLIGPRKAARIRALLTSPFSGEGEVAPASDDSGRKSTGLAESKQ